MADFNGAANLQWLSAIGARFAAVTVRKSNHSVTLMSRSMETLRK